MRSPTARFVVLAVVAMLSLIGCKGRVTAGGGASGPPSVGPTAPATVTPSPGPTPSPALTAAAAVSVTCSSGTFTSTSNQTSGLESTGQPTPRGGVSLTAGWTSRAGGGNPLLKGATITLEVAGSPLLTEAIDPPHITGTAGSAYAGGWEGIAPVCLQTGSGPPLAYLNGFAGGMNCCFIVRAYFPEGTGTYGETDHLFARAPITVTAVDGRGIVESGNPDFQGAFDCEACSGVPLQVLNLVTGTFVDVTRQFPALISADAAVWGAAVKRGSASDPYGVLPPYVADECELGQQTQAYSMMDSMLATGGLKSPPVQASGADYVAAVKALLVKDGYCS